MRVVWTGINLEVFHDPPRKSVGREHPAHRLGHNPFRVFALKNLFHRSRFYSPRIPGVPVVGLVLALPSGQLNLVGIDNYDVVAAVHVSSENRLVFAAQTCGHYAREPTKNDTFGINDDPILPDVAGFG